MNFNTDLLGDTYWNSLSFYMWLRKMGLYETIEIIFKHDTMMINYYYADEVLKSFAK